MKKAPLLTALILALAAMMAVAAPVVAGDANRLQTDVMESEVDRGAFSVISLNEQQDDE